MDVSKKAATAKDKGSRCNQILFYKLELSAFVS